MSYLAKVEKRHCKGLRGVRPGNKQHELRRVKRAFINTLNGVRPGNKQPNNTKYYIYVLMLDLMGVRELRTS